MSKLSPQQEKFIQLFHKTGNATESYKKVYNCGLKASESSSSALLSIPKVRERLQALQQSAAKKCEIKIDDLIKKNAEIAFHDYNDALEMDDDGDPKIVDNVDFNLLDGVTLSKTESMNESEHGIQSSKSVSFSLKNTNRIKALQELARLIGAYDEKGNSENDRGSNLGSIFESIRRFKK